MSLNHNLTACQWFPNVYIEAGNNTTPYATNGALNVVLAILGGMANGLIFSAIKKSVTMHLPSKLLLCNLILSDIGVNLAVQPLFITYLIAMVFDGPYGIRCFALASSQVASSLLVMVSLITMTFISLDRFIALFSHVGYRGIVTTKRVGAVIIFTWTFSVFSASTWIWNTRLQYPLVISTISLSFLFTSFAYTKIYRRLREPFPHQVEQAAESVSADQGRARTGSTLNIAKYRRTASSMLGIYCLYILCFLPYACAVIARQIIGYSIFMQQLFEFTGTIVYLNSCLNPFVYCLRLPDIRAAVLQTIRGVCAGSNPQQ